MNNFLTIDADRKWFKSVLQHLEEYFESLEKRYENLKQKYNDLHDEKWESKELQRMNQELETMRANYHRGFPIDEADNKKINNWILKHDEEVHNNPNHRHGVSGGGYEYSFYPTGLGTIGYCICSACKNKALRINDAKYWDYLKEHNGYIEFGDFG